MTKEDILQLVKDNIITTLDHVQPSDLKSSESMVNLGANSLDRAEIIISTLSDLSLKIPIAEFKGLDSIGEIVNFLYEKEQSSNS